MNREEFIREFIHVKRRLEISYPIPHKVQLHRLEDGTFNLFVPYFWLQELFHMAAKKNSKKRTPFGNVEFINYKFDKAEKTKFEDWYISKDNAFIGALHETIQGENKISLSWDDQNECFIGSMTGKEDSLNPNKCIVIRSADWAKALAALAYIHTVIFDGEIWDVSGETDMV